MSTEAPKPPPGLENFAAGLKQGINNHLAQQRQQELERINAEMAIKLAEFSKQVELAQKQREIREARAKMMAEARQVLNELQVEDKLRYIQRMIWRGKGRIRNVEPKPEVDKYQVTGIQADYYDVLGGLELVHEYTLAQHESTTPMSEDGPLSTYYRWVPRTSSTTLSVSVLLSHGSREGEKTLAIGSDAETNEAGGIPDVHSQINQRFPRFISYGSDLVLGRISIFGATITPIASKDLDRTLLQETEVRLANNLLPSHLEQRAGKFLAEAKAKPTWNRWVPFDSR